MRDRLLKVYTVCFRLADALPDFGELRRSCAEMRGKFSVLCGGTFLGWQTDRLDDFFRILDVWRTDRRGSLRR